MTPTPPVPGRQVRDALILAAGNGDPRDPQDTMVRARLMEQMITAWTNFAKTGDPNGEGLPEWPRFNPETQPTMRFGTDTRVQNAPFHAEYLAMAEFMKTFNIFDVFK